MQDQKKAKSQLELWIQIGGLVIGLVALIATVFFSIKSDRTKELTVSFSAVRPLVFSEGAKTTATLEIRLAGNKVAAPWLLSGRIVNSGSLPIEERDIELPLQLRFEKTRVLSAEISQKSHDALFAALQTDSDSIKLQHKLLNPGDWIAFDVIFDGEPILPPKSLARISGVAETRFTLPASGQTQYHITVVDVPRPFAYLVTFTSGLLAIFLFGAGPILIATTFRDAMRQAPPNQSQRSYSFSPEQIESRMLGLSPSSKEASAVFSLLQRRITIAQLDDPDALARAISEVLPKSTLDSIGTTPSAAAIVICYELKSALRDSLATHVYLSLPPGPDRVHREAIKRLDMSTTSAIQLRQYVESALITQGRDLPLRKRLAVDDIVVGSVMFLIGSSLILVIGGSIRTLTSM
jgi:hypothetical protein